ncbi:MAG TPA: hypothetical protein ENN73_04325 [Firmicutes bacterium]|nr:hypothetical protein [Bacillota bacterium]
MSEETQERFSVKLYSTGGVDLRKELVKIFSEGDEFNLLELSKAEPSLEEIFMNILEKKE